MRRRYPARVTPHKINVKYDAPCATCGETIRKGESATYYPPGTFGPGRIGRVAHITAKCDPAGKDRSAEAAAVNDYAGDGLDSRYEDQCAEICGR